MSAFERAMGARVRKFRSFRGTAGFSLAENLFAAVIMGIVIAGMAELLSSYTMSYSRSGDVGFAVDLAQSQLDMIDQQVKTQTSIAFDKSGMARTYEDERVNTSLSQYFFNNFPSNAVPDNSVAMAQVPWPDPTVGWSAYFQETPFFHNRYYDGGGKRLDQDGATTVYAAVTGNPSFATQMLTPDPPHFVVRLQLFGVSWSSSGTSGESDVDQYLSCADQYSNNGVVPTTPPSSCPQLIADSCADTSGTPPCSGQMWIDRTDPATGLPETSTDPYPDFFDEYTSKILVAQVYRAADFLNYKTFYDSGTGHMMTPLASASAVLQGALVLR